MTKVWGLGKLSGLAMAATVAVIGISLQPADAAVILDQANAEEGFVNFLGPTSSTGQTFTVGIAGIFDHIDVHLRKTFPSQGPAPDYGILMELQGVTGTGAADGNVLASALVDGSTLPDAPGDTAPYTVFDISSFGVTATVGDMFAIVLTAQGSSSSSADWNVFVSTAASDLYTAGTKLNNGETPTGGDLAFETYMSTGGEVVTAPEPGAILIVGLGILGLGAMRRRNRTA